MDQTELNIDTNHVAVRDLRGPHHAFFQSHRINHTKVVAARDRMISRQVYITRHYHLPKCHRCVLSIPLTLITWTATWIALEFRSVGTNRHL